VLPQREHQLHLADRHHLNGRFLRAGIGVIRAAAVVPTATALACHYATGRPPPASSRTGRIVIGFSSASMVALRSRLHF
jgi:hypothetical protein